MSRWSRSVPLLPVVLCVLSGIFFAESSHVLASVLCVLGLALALVSRAYVLLPSVIVGILVSLMHYHHLKQVVSFEKQAGIWWKGTVQVVDEDRYGRWKARVLEPEFATLNLLVSKRNMEYEADVGDYLMLEGKLRFPESARNPAEFDRKQWLQQKGIVSELELLRCEHTQGSNVNPLRDGLLNIKDVANRFRDRAVLGMTAGMSEPAATMIPAMVLGIKPSYQDPLNKAFRESGSMHVFAVSGLHVMMLGSMVALLLRLTGMPKAWWVSGVIASMFFYALVTGFNPPAVRASIMGSLCLMGLVVNRQVVLLNSVAASALLVLVADSHAIFQPGFQLSFVVLIAIAVLLPWTQKLYAGIVYLDPFLPYRLLTKPQLLSLRCRKSVQASFSVSTCAVLGASPLSWYYFGIVTPVSILAGLPLLILLYGILANAMLAVFVSAVVPAMLPPVNRCNEFMANRMHQWVLTMSKLPSGHWKNKEWQDGECLVIYSIPNGGAAAYTSLGGGCLIDTASSFSFSRYVEPSLIQYAAPLDSVIVSHADSQHCGALAELFSEFEIQQVGLPNSQSRSASYSAAVDQAASHGVQCKLLSSGMELPLSKVAALKVLDGSSYSKLADDTGLVLLLEWRSKRILFFGDAGFLKEQAIREKHPRLEVDVIVLGNHARDIGPSDAWLSSMNPSLIITEKPRVPLAGIQQHLLGEEGAWSLEWSQGEWLRKTY